MITEKQYLEYLIKQYQNLIYSICLKSIGNPFDAEDLTQEVFLSAYKNLSRFDGTYEKAWLSKIAIRKCLDYLKASGRRSIPMEDTYFSFQEDPGQSPEHVCLEEEVREELYRSCRELKPPYNEIALDYYYYEMDVGEIARKRERNVKTVQTQIYRARGMLRKHYQKKGEKSA